MEPGDRTTTVLDHRTACLRAVRGGAVNPFSRALDVSWSTTMWKGTSPFQIWGHDTTAEPFSRRPVGRRVGVGRTRTLRDLPSARCAAALIC